VRILNSGNIIKGLLAVFLHTTYCTGTGCNLGRSLVVNSKCLHNNFVSGFIIKIADLQVRVRTAEHYVNCPQRTINLK
jgi:hypothetical protein